MRGGEAARLRELSAEQLELQSELEAVHTEHAQRLGEVRQEQRQLEHRLEQLRQQSCACQPKEQEAQYNAQVNEGIRGVWACLGIIPAVMHQNCTYQQGVSVCGSDSVAERDTHILAVTGWFAHCL